MSTALSIHSQVRISHHDDPEPPRVLEAAARWNGDPDFADHEYDGEGKPIGPRVVRLLADGQTVKIDHLSAGAAWLDAMADWYYETDPPLPAFAADWKIASADCRLGGRLIGAMAEACRQVHRSVAVMESWDDRT